MDFFEHQEKAKKKTGVLIVYFILAVVLIILTVCFTLSILLAHRPWNPQLFVLVAPITIAIVGFGCLFKIIELRSGGASVAMSLGGQKISSVTRDPAERRLMNVVEEMAIASGVPVPEVYVMNGEQGINAFAAGTSTANAVIGVTRGCIQNLTRDELQGVIGHEFSHILNGDMKMNLNLMGWIFGILCLSSIGEILLRARSSNSRDKNPLPLIGLVLIVIGSIGVFFARLIQSAVSRQREFLADASAVQFTRNPNGLVGALKKIGGLVDGSKLNAPTASEASHLFFGNGLAESWFGLMATHPPLEDRIRAIDSTFNGKFPSSFERVQEDEELSLVSGFSSAPGKSSVMAGTVVSRTGALTGKHIQYAADLRKAIPSQISETARESSGACALIYALLLSEDSHIRSIQISHLPEMFRQESNRLFAITSKLETRLKLPLVNLALNGLRAMSANQYVDFKRIIHLLMESDQQIDLFEYVLQKVVTRHLDSKFEPRRPSAIQFYSMLPLQKDGVILISMLARHGHSEMDKVSAAFSCGMNVLGVPKTESILMECGLDELDASLEKFAAASPAIRKRVLDACAQTVAMDGVIEEWEAELLRAIADTLGCPIPPMIEGV